MTASKPISGKRKALVGVAYMLLFALGMWVMNAGVLKGVTGLILGMALLMASVLVMVIGWPVQGPREPPAPPGS